MNMTCFHDAVQRMHVYYRRNLLFILLSSGLCAISDANNRLSLCVRSASSLNASIKMGTAACRVAWRRTCQVWTLDQRTRRRWDGKMFSDIELQLWTWTGPKWLGQGMYTWRPGARTMFKSENTLIGVFSFWALCRAWSTVLKLQQNEERKKASTPPLYSSRSSLQCILCPLLAQGNLGGWGSYLRGIAYWCGIRGNRDMNDS
jgi:hypothetical protein